MEKFAERLKEIANMYGLQKQSGKTIEELNELAVALAHKNRREIVSEIADVKIMVAQLEYLLDIKEDVYLDIEYKVNRTMMQIDKIKE